jgi:ABC-type oligopeptide transport system ATPase subunit/mono/diheme cytochrome c family protein
MKSVRSTFIPSVFTVIAAGSISLTHTTFSAEPVLAQSDSSEAEIDPIVLKDKAMRIMETHCYSCHGAKEQEGDIRLDQLDTIDPADLQKLLSDANEAVLFEDMPPEDEKQPSEADRKILIKWLESQVKGDAAEALAEKLRRSEYGNVVKHEELFSGKNTKLPGFTTDRRWLVSEYIFNEKINRLLDYQPERKIYGTNQKVAGDSGIHWSPKTEHGNKFRRTITNPFLLPEKVGVRYFDQDRLTTGHLLTMVGNAKRVAEQMASEGSMKAHYPAMHELMKTEFEHRKILKEREQFLTTYGYMERLLKDIYQAKHESLLPKVKRIDIPYPPAPMRGGKPSGREMNLGLIPRLDNIDVEAIYHGIATHDGDDFKVVVIPPEAGSPYETYAQSTLDAYNEIILKCERDWIMEGVTDNRIKNRISIMKVFYASYDFAGIYNRIIKPGKYDAQKFIPRSESEMAVITATIKKCRKPGDTYLQIIEKCMTDWEAGFLAEREAAGGFKSDLVEQMIISLYVRAFERKPTETEIAENAEQLKLYREKLEPQQAITKLIESLVLSSEFAYRHEFGTGKEDEHGRRMMPSRDASYALAYALTDSSPDAELVKAAAEGRLNTREDYEREVRRMLARRDKWTIIDETSQALGLNACVTNQPIRKLRFFRDFFGYPKAMKVFKDDVRFGAGSHEATVSRAVDEADMLVEYILEKDKQVFEELLTTEKFYVYHNGDNAAMQAASHTYKETYEYFKKLDWKNLKPEDLNAHAEFMKTKGVKELKEFQPAKASHTLGLLKTFMKTAEFQFSSGQKNAVPFMFAAYGFWHGGPVLGRTGQQMRGQQVTTYWNIDYRTWDFPTEQPAKIPNRKGILTHPAWLIAHSQNLESDPIHRGKWVQEKLLAGSIPDVPITVDAVIDPDHTKTMRQRMEIKTGAVSCWRCHQKMDPLGFPFEIYDDFGRFRTEENLEHADNLLKPAPSIHAPANELIYGASLPVYKTLPVNPKGVLEGTGDPKLDGEVKDAFDLIDRLAKADKTRQSIIRHAFRFFMGRNETLSDSKTLIDAEQAYLKSEGSFDEVIISLLTSDSFIYRKPVTEN